MATSCSCLVRKNRANKLGPRVECGGEAVVIYHAPSPDAYGVSDHPRCEKHDTKGAREYAAENDWKVETL